MYSGKPLHLGMLPALGDPWPPQKKLHSRPKTLKNGHCHGHGNRFGHSQCHISSAFPVTVPKTYNTLGLCRARATFYIRCAAAALDHIKPDGFITITITTPIGAQSTP